MLVLKDHVEGDIATLAKMHNTLVQNVTNRDKVIREEFKAQKAIIDKLVDVVEEAAPGRLQALSQVPSSMDDDTIVNGPKIREKIDYMKTNKAKIPYRATYWYRSVQIMTLFFPGDEYSLDTKDKKAERALSQDAMKLEFGPVNPKWWDDFKFSDHPAPLVAKKFMEEVLGYNDPNYLTAIAEAFAYVVPAHNRLGLTKPRYLEIGVTNHDIWDALIMKAGETKKLEGGYLRLVIRNEVRAYFNVLTDFRSKYKPKGWTMEIRFKGFEANGKPISRDGDVNKPPTFDRITLLYKNQKNATSATPDYWSEMSKEKLFPCGEPDLWEENSRPRNSNRIVAREVAPRIGGPSFGRNVARGNAARKYIQTRQLNLCRGIDFNSMPGMSDTDVSSESDSSMIPASSFEGGL